MTETRYNVYIMDKWDMLPSESIGINLPTYEEAEELAEKAKTWKRCKNKHIKIYEKTIDK